MNIEAQTWANVPPFEAKKMYRAYCSCGWRGEWFAYKGNVTKTCGAALPAVLREPEQ